MELLWEESCSGRGRLEAVEYDYDGFVGEASHDLVEVTPLGRPQARGRPLFSGARDHGRSASCQAARFDSTWASPWRCSGTRPAVAGLVPSLRSPGAAPAATGTSRGRGTGVAALTR